MIYITSDLHLCHDRDFCYSKRGYQNVEEMNKGIIENWNNIINDDDDVYVLGDLTMRDNNNVGIELLKTLKGKIHIIRGNHDSDSKMAQYATINNVVEICDAKYLRYGKYHLFMSHFPSITSNWDYDKPLKHRIINLCGHTHTKDRFSDWDKGLIYHCELDAHDNKPVAIDEILEEIKKKIGA